MSTEDVFPREPAWVNEGYWRYHATRAEEDYERVIRAEDIEIPLLSEPIPAVEDETQILSKLPGGTERTQVLTGALERSKALDTERMKRRDWVELQNARRTTGKHSNSIYVVGIFALALLMMGVVWLAAAWIEYILALNLF
jgi:hypothetical protein